MQKHLTVFYTGLYRALTFPRRLDEVASDGSVVHYSAYGTIRNPNDRPPSHPNVRTNDGSVVFTCSQSLKSSLLQSSPQTLLQTLRPTAAAALAYSTHSLTRFKLLLVVWLIGRTACLAAH